MLSMAKRFSRLSSRQFSSMAAVSSPSAVFPLSFTKPINHGPRDISDAYDKSHIANHMRRRRIITNDSDLPSTILNRTIQNLVMVERLNQDKWSCDDKKINEFESDLHDAVRDKKLAFGTPLLTNLGQAENPSLAPMACTVLKLPQSISMNNLVSAIQPAALKGQGVGFDLTQYEDPVAMLESLNEALQVLDASCVRTVAGMATLEAEHPKIGEFIKAKRDWDFSTGRFNISVKISNKCMESSSKSEMIETIADCIHYCAEPGILFNDRLEMDNPTPSLPYLSTAPCAELAMSEGDGCHFAYLNLSQFVRRGFKSSCDKDTTLSQLLTKIDWDELHLVTANTTQLLDNAVEISSLLGQEDVRLKRRVGVGVCGFADLLLTLGLSYSDPRSEMIAEEIMSFVNFISKMTSVRLSAERGRFDIYEQSKYKTDEQWVKRFGMNATNMVSKNDWNEYSLLQSKYGIRNATTTALPPTGNAALVLDASQSIEPYFSLFDVWDSSKLSPFVEQFVASQQNEAEIRNAIMSGKKEDAGAIPSVLETATKIDPMCHIGILKPFQKHIDDSISKTINLPNNYTKDDIVSLIRLAYDYGLKGITLFRDGCLDERHSHN